MLFKTKNFINRIVLTILNVEKLDKVDILIEIFVKKLFADFICKNDKNNGFFVIFYWFLIKNLRLNIKNSK